MTKELTDAFNELKTTVEAFQTENDKLQNDLKEKGTADVILVEKVDKINEALEEITTKYEEAVTAMNRPAKAAVTASGNEIPEEEKEYTEKYLDYFLNGGDELKKEIIELGANPELKLIQVGVNADGGFAVPTVIDSEMTERFVEVDSMRELARVIRVSTTDWKHLANRRGATSGWVGETDVRAGTDTPTLAKIDLVSGEVYANPSITQYALEDPFFDMEQFLKDNVIVEMALQEADAFANGDSVKKPKGLYTVTTALTADDTRAFETYQHVVTATSGAFDATDPADVLYDVQGELKRAYTANAKWMMNRATKTTIRKFKDGQGNYLLTFPTSVGEPMLLLGDPVMENQHVPAIAADSLSISYGDHRAGYLIADIGNMVFLRNPYAQLGQIGLYHSKRVAGMPTDSEAVKFVKFSA